MKIHIIGICGIGMSAIAQILQAMNYTVQGSDMNTEGYIADKLRSVGINVISGHDKKNITDADLIIKSTAIKDDCSEIIASKALNKNIYTRTQALAMLLHNKKTIAISGAHGKSTSTAMVYLLLESALLQPSLICGAIVNNIENNAKFGKSDIFVLEADESDGAFSQIQSYFCGALTNIDIEHLDYYGDFETLIKHYKIFISNVETNGIIAICKDDERLFNISESMHDKSCIVYYAIDSEAEIKATNIRLNYLNSKFDIKFSGKLSNVKPIYDIELNLPGKHNIYNALVAISIATKFNLSGSQIKSTLKEFLGLKRRFTILGKINNATIVDDYAHHPTEIISTIDSVKDFSKVICVIQPHRFTRVKMLFEQYVNLFNKASYTFLLNVYSAGEKEIENCNSIDIIKNAITKGIHNVELVENEHELYGKILSKISDGDIVIFFGAGNVTNLANNFFANIKAI